MPAQKPTTTSSQTITQVGNWDVTPPVAPIYTESAYPNAEEEIVAPDGFFVYMPVQMQNQDGQGVFALPAAYTSAHITAASITQIYGVGVKPFLAGEMVTANNPLGWRYVHNSKTTSRTTIVTKPSAVSGYARYLADHDRYVAHLLVLKEDLHNKKVLKRGIEKDFVLKPKESDMSNFTPAHMSQIAGSKGGATPNVRFVKKTKTAPPSPDPEMVAAKAALKAAKKERRKQRLQHRAATIPAASEIRKVLSTGKMEFRKAVATGRAEAATALAKEKVEVLTLTSARRVATAHAGIAKTINKVVAKDRTAVYVAADAVPVVQVTDKAPSMERVMEQTRIKEEGDSAPWTTVKRTWTARRDVNAA